MRQAAAAIIGLFVLCCPSWADTAWAPLTGAPITKALSDKGLAYDTATQHFYASGRTLYNSGADSWGYWWVEGDSYCSQWPPANGWACYRMARNAEGTALKFIGDSGAETIGIYQD